MTTKEACINIWRECFGDSEEFINLYFTRRYSDDCTFVSRDGNEIVAASQCFIYDMTTANNDQSSAIVKAGYVSGLATLPQHRRKGHARHIMQQMHKWLHQQGAAYCILIPSGNDAAQWYHSQFGYEYGLRNNKYILPPELLSHYTLEQTLSPDALRLINSDMIQRPHFILHTADDLTDQLNTCIMSGGGLYTKRTVEGQLQEVLFVEYHNHQPILLDYFTSKDNPTANHNDFITTLPLLDCQQGMWVAIDNAPTLPPTARLSLMLD